MSLSITNKKSTVVTPRFYLLNIDKKFKEITTKMSERIQSKSIQKPSQKKKSLSNYYKRHLLKMLKESNCHPMEVQAMVNRSKMDEERIKSMN